MASSATNSDPAELVASLFGVMTIPVLLVIIHGAVAGNIECVYSAPLCFLAGGIEIKRWLGSIISGVIGSAVLGRVPGVHQFRPDVHQLHGLVRDLDGRMGGDRGLDFFVLNRGRADLPALYASPETSRYGDIRWRSLVARCWSGWSRGGRSSTAGCHCSRVRFRASPKDWTVSWLASIVFGGLAYWLLCRSERRICRGGFAWLPRREARSRPARSPGL